MKSYRTDSPHFPLPANVIYTFWHDKELDINWFGFASDGICYNYYRKDIFHIYRYKDFDSNLLPIRSFCIHGDDKVIGTRDGLYYINEKRDIIRHFTSKEIGGRIVTNVKFFNNYFLISTYERGISLLDPVSLKIKHLGHNNLLKYGNFSRIEPYQGKEFFACGNTGIFVFDKDFNIRKHYHSRNSELPNDYICDIIFDLTGKGWIGTMNQLVIFDPITQMMQARDFPEGYFNQESTLTFSMCRNGDIIAISDNSVFRSKSDLSHYTTIDLHQRLKVEYIYFIKENREGKYWLGTDKGLFLFEKDFSSYVQFNENYNLPALKFNRNEIQETPDGIFWWGNTKGLVYLKPESQSLLKEKVPGKIVLTQMMFNKNEADERDFEEQLEKKRIHVKWNFGNELLSLYPILLNYAKPQGRYYEWSLDNKSYISCTDGEAVNPGKLSLGAHTIKIRLAGHEESATSYKIMVLPSIAFYLEILLFISTITGVWYTKRLRKKRKMLKLVLEQKHHLDTEIAIKRAIEAHVEEEEKKKNETQEAKMQAMYERSRINQNEYKQLHKKVKECMEIQKIYTNPNLRITDLAEMIESTPAKLSQMFNLYLKRNFFDYINQYRVEEFKRRATCGKYNQYSVTALSEMCGFKRSTFFATFKKYEQCTPNEYMQKNGHFKN